MKKAVLFYESAPDFRTTGPRHFADHVARWKTYQDRGELLMIGTYTDAALGALAIFTTREAAEEFARDDPFVVNGVVSRWEVRDWNEAIAEP
jgi:uncharacterized protein